MSSAPRNPDKLNTIGIVVVGVCGAVLVYVSIVALQAFYMTDTSGVQTLADYGGQDATFKSIKAAQLGNITEYASNTVAAGKPQTYRIHIDHAMDLVVDQLRPHADGSPIDPAALIPGLRSDTPSVQPIYGRPKAIVAPAPATPPADGAGSGSGAGSAAPAAGSGAGSAAPAAANPATGDARLAPPVSTGGAPGTGVPSAGSGPLPAGSPTGTATGSGSAAAPVAPAAHAP